MKKARQINEREVNTDPNDERLFHLSLDDLREVYCAWRRYYNERGYHSWAYWHTTTEAGDIFGSLLEDAIMKSAPEEWEAIEAEMMTALSDDEAATDGTRR